MQPADRDPLAVGVPEASAPPAPPGLTPKPTPTPDPRRAVGPLSPSYRALTIAMVALAGLAAFESLAVTVTMPAVVDALGGLELYAMAFAAPLAASIAGLVAGGSWADRGGPRAPLFTGIALFALGVLAAGTATSMDVLVAGRAVQGLGTGLLNVAMYVVVARVYPDAIQARVFAAFAAAWVLPSIVGPAIAGLISAQLGWRWVFLLVPVLVVPTVVLLVPALARMTGAGAVGLETGAADAPGQATRAGRDARRLVRAVGAGAALFALHLGGQRSGPSEWLLLGGGLALLAVTIGGLIPAGTLRAARGLPAVVGVRGLISAAFFGAEVYLPLMFTRERGLSVAEAGLALTAAALTWSTGSWLRGRREGRWEDSAVLRIGSALIAAGIGVAALAIWPAVPIAASLLGWAAAGFGMGLAFPTLSLLTLRLSAPAEQGLNTAGLQVFDACATSAVLALSGPVVAALLTSGLPVAAFAVCFGLSGALALAAVAASGRIVPISR